MDRTLQLLLGIQHQHTDILRAADEIGRARAAQLVPGAEAPQNAAARKPGIAGRFDVHAAVPHIQHLLRRKAEGGAHAVHKMRSGFVGCPAYGRPLRQTDPENNG